MCKIKRIEYIAALLLVCTLATTITFAATIKKKNRQVVNGEIQGLIVQRENISASREGGKITYSAKYQLVNGSEVSAIDEGGVHWTTNKVSFFSVSQEDTPLDDVDVLETGMNTPPGSIFGGYTKAGGLVVAIGGRTLEEGGTCSDKLLGEFRINPLTKKGQIIPALELATANGTVKISVIEIVAFKKTAGEGSVHKESDTLSGTEPKPSKAKAGKNLPSKETAGNAAISDRTATTIKSAAAAPSHRGKVAALEITPDSRLLASASYDGSIKLWSLPEGKMLRSLTGHKSGVYSMVMSPDGSSLISGSHEDSIIVWSLPGGQILNRLDSQEQGSITAMAIPRKGNILAVGTFASAITFWSLPQGQQLKSVRAAGGLNALAMTPDGTIVAGGSFGPIELWSLPDGNPIASLNLDRRSVIALTVTPDGGILVSACENENIIRLWSLAEHKLLAELKSNSNGIDSLAVTPDGKILAAGGAEGTLEFFSLPDGALQTAVTPGSKNSVCALKFSPSGNLLAFGDEKGIVSLWDCEKKMVIRSLSGQ
jgi:WD40 repeat protein